MHHNDQLSSQGCVSLLRDCLQGWRQRQIGTVGIPLIYGVATAAADAHAERLTRLQCLVCRLQRVVMVPIIPARYSLM